MRISAKEVEFFKNTIILLKPEAKVYLFGSRADNEKRGGDIDILILSNEKLTRQEIRKIKNEFYLKFGEQKLDLVSFTFNEEDPFKQIALSEGVQL